MKSLILTFFPVVFTLIYVNCSKNKEAVTQFDDEFWSSPNEDAFVLFFRLSDAIKADSLFAGKIQFRLDSSRTVDEELENISAMKAWEFGSLLLGVSDELYSLFDTNTYRFNYQPLDSLLDAYGLISGRKLSGFPGAYVVKLIFSTDYNMPILAKEFDDIPGIWAATANYTGILPEGPPFDIYLEIDGNIYKFIFYINDWKNNYVHHWEVHVVDDRAELISEW